MAYRRFMDSSGTTWRVWDVTPLRLNRRLAIRRIRVIRIRHPERRVLPERRLDMRRSRLYFPPSEKGWLCFESEVARLRLRPIPPGWVLEPDEGLEELCRRAAVPDNGSADG